MTQTRAALRREQLRILLASVPVLLAASFLVEQVGSFSQRPVTVAVVVLPLLVVVIVLGRPIVRERRLILGGGFLPFFVGYCLLFSIAAGTRILEGRRVAVPGFENEAPSNVLGLSRLGDWHYRFAPRPPRAGDIVVIALPSFEGVAVDTARRTQAELIARATAYQAKGIAFDYYLATPSSLDRTLCFRIDRAEAEGVPVVYGYRVDERAGASVRVVLAPAIASCMRPDRLGTLTGLLEQDRRVRMVPTSHLADTTLRSFSWRIAALLARGEDRLPRVGLAQFVVPDSPIVVIDGVPDDPLSELLRDRFVMVGSNRAEELRATPYGSMFGVLIHAYAAHALRTGHVIRRVDARWLLPAIFALCYVLTLLQAGGGGVRPLLAGAAILSLAVIAAAVLALRVGLFWIDVSYPLIAVWGMTGVLAGGARLQRGRAAARVVIATDAPARAHAAAVSATEPFDVFLSHNSQDKPPVMELAAALRERGLRVWLDEWELVPGRPWQEAIEEAITSVRSAAVLVGSDGLGPWEEPEMRACLDQCVKRKMPVIPVLLPGAPEQPKLPLFLTQFTWVDLRVGFTEPGLRRLEWGITGLKPR